MTNPSREEIARITGETAWLIEETWSGYVHYIDRTFDAVKRRREADSIDALPYEWVRNRGGFTLTRRKPKIGFITKDANEALAFPTEAVAKAWLAAQPRWMTHSDQFQPREHMWPSVDALALSVPTEGGGDQGKQEVSSDANALTDLSSATGSGGGEGGGTTRTLEGFQSGVHAWMLACFGEEISRDRIERNHRFLEEAVELVQANGCTASEAHQLVDYVYGRPVGELRQEVGGVMVCIAALCTASNLGLAGCAETELARVWTKVEQIRAKQKTKPKHSPLPSPPCVSSSEQNHPTTGSIPQTADDKPGLNPNPPCVSEGV